MNSLINNSPSATPFGSPFGTPFVSSFTSPFSSFNGSFTNAGFGQIGTPMFTNSFGSNFGPFSTPFGGQFTNQFGAPAGWPISGQFTNQLVNQLGGQFGSQFNPFASNGFGPFGFGQPTWNQGFGSFQAPVGSPISNLFGLGGGQFGSPVTPFNSFGQFGPFGTLPTGGYTPFNTPFASSMTNPFASGFGGVPQGDWSVLGGRFGSLPTGFATPFSTPFSTPFGGSFGGQGVNQFGVNQFGLSPSGVQGCWNTGASGYSPVGNHVQSPMSGVWGQPISGGFSPWNSPHGQTGIGGFGAPTTGVSGFGSTSTASTNGQNANGYSNINPITGTASNGIGGNSLSPTLNQIPPVYSAMGIGSYGTLPAQLVAGQFGTQFGSHSGNQLNNLFGGQLGVQGWNGPITGSTPNQFTGQPVGYGTQLVTGGYGQPIFQTVYPTGFQNGFQTGFQSQGPISHGNPNELRTAAGTTINVSQREAA